jgi:hypothetical protein
LRIVNVEVRSGMLVRFSSRRSFANVFLERCDRRLLKRCDIIGKILDAIVHV